MCVGRGGGCECGCFEIVNTLVILSSKVMFRYFFLKHSFAPPR